MAVEPGTVDDVDTVADLWVALAREQTRFGSHVRPDSNRTAIRDELARYAATDRLLVARDDGIVGFATYTIEDGTYGLDVVRGLVENIYVRPAFRDEGVGSDLLAAAERRLTDRGADVVALETLADNADARRFYRQSGYSAHRVEFEKPLESDNHSKDEG
jgi:ribosomal protein S18 acetylase RimI-like enzyme